MFNKSALLFLKKKVKILENRLEYEEYVNNVNYEANKNNLRNSIHYNPSSLINLMHGGSNPFTNEDKKKINSIRKAFEELGKMDPDLISKKKKEIIEKLNETNKIIESLPDASTLSSDNINPDRFLDYMKEIQISIGEFKQGYVEVYPRLSKIALPLIKDTKVDTVGIKNQFEQFNSLITNYIHQVNESNGKQQAEFLKQASAYIEASKDFKVAMIDASRTITTVNEELSLKNKKFDDDFNFTIDEAKFQTFKIIDVKELIKLIKENKNTSPDFQSQMTAVCEEYNNKKIKLRDFVDIYNSLIASEKNIGSLPKFYFNGKYTFRIDNTLLGKNSVAEQKISIINDMLIVDFKGNLADAASQQKGFNLSHIYKPSFSDFKGGALSDVTRMRGGTLDAAISPLIKSQGEIIKIYDAYRTESIKYKNNIKDLNKNFVYNLAHTSFLLLIISNDLYTEGYVINKYFNRGQLSFYQRILEDIFDKIKNKNSYSNTKYADVILYLSKYHYVTITKLKNFLEKVIPIMSSQDVIEVGKCTGIYSNNFFLLNYFKDILGAYNEIFQSKITIYARINDIRQKGIDPQTEFEIFKKKKMFMSDRERFVFYKKAKDDKIQLGEFNDPEFDPIAASTTKKMWIRSEPCDSLNKKKIPLKSIEFTEVFDTLEFPNNGDISKYMTLDTQLAQGKGVCFITYGYSGAGKTYTVFGDKESGKEGILQATLDNISGLIEVKFRLYEIYGMGMPYPHYWEDLGGKSRLESIYNYIYKYRLSEAINLLGGNELNVVQLEKCEPKDIKQFVESQDNDSGFYYSIKGDKIGEIFRNFDTFVNQVDEKRKLEKRIRDTPNNIVSSRSVLIYDFMLKVAGNGDKFVPFVIIDLPGREEIAQTYVDPYFSNEKIKNMIFEGSQALNLSSNLSPDRHLLNENKLKLMLACMTINPVAIPIFDPEMVLSILYNGKNNIQEILNQEIDVEQEFDSDKVTIDALRSKWPQGIFTTSGSIIKMTVKCKLADEPVNRIGLKLSYFINFNTTPPSVNDAKGFGYDKISYQGLALLCMHIINRVILKNKFDILKEIYGHIVDKYINEPILSELKKIQNLSAFIDELILKNFKGEKLKKMLQENYQLNVQIVYDAIKYDYYITGFEGVYINENIMGLIKFLVDKLVADPSEKEIFLKKRIQKQSKTLNFQLQQKNARTWLISGTKTPSEIQKFYGFKNLNDVDDENPGVPSTLFEYVGDELLFKEQECKTEYEKIANKKYKSNKIFNFDHPLITNILEPYLSHTDANKLFKPIDDYKVFYLFGNYVDDSIRNLKCEHQYKLYTNTADFIDTIVNKKT